MPMSSAFKNRLYPVLAEIVQEFGTPFHIYDETGIRQTAEHLKQAFAAFEGFREYFAVKALPNPRILDIMRQEGFGLDCSSIAELVLSRRQGARGKDLMFTSNNTSGEEFDFAARDGGSILNLDDISLISKVPEMPETICFRYNPGPRRTGNSIIGNPVEAKYGVAHDQICEAYRLAIKKGARKFGLHTMLVSNERDYRYMVQTAEMLLDISEWVGRELDIAFDFINIGGGLGIPYRLDETPLDLGAMADGISRAFAAFRGRNGYEPKLHMESGRYMTGPHGTLVVTALNQKNTYRKYVGVDASMSALMRPAMYGAYHHITIPAKENSTKFDTVDVVGSLCENNDKFATLRRLPKIHDGDILCIHDTGAHGHAMGFNYNGRLRPKELLLRTDGRVQLIRRAETIMDHLATLEFAPKTLTPVAEGMGALKN
jgi:diaminopimelate decarboxylase